MNVGEYRIQYFIGERLYQFDVELDDGVEIRSDERKHRLVIRNRPSVKVLAVWEDDVTARVTITPSLKAVLLTETIHKWKKVSQRQTDVGRSP